MLIRLSAFVLAAGVLSPSVPVVVALSGQDIPVDTPISSLLSSAHSHLARGETSDALVYYDAALSRDPSDYLTYFKRATTHLSLGRTAQATDDFNKVIALKPGFEGAHVQLGKLKARIADWDGAREQLMMARKGPGSKEMDEIMEAQGAATLAETAEQNGNFEDCINHAGIAIMIASRSVSLRQLRSRCRFARGEVEEGMGDLHHILQMKPGDITPHITISAVTFFALGDLQNGISQIRKCLHSDPDSKACRRLLKQEKAIEKAHGDIIRALEKKQPMTAVRMLVSSEDEQGLIKDVKSQVQALRDDGTIPGAAPNKLIATLVGFACQGFYEMNSKKAKEYCAEALELDSDSFYGLLSQADSQLAADELEQAIASLKRAGEVRPDKQDLVNPLMQKAQIALKRSKTKDYYKVLGVAHDADERQIKSAYRKLSKQHHPDKAAKQGLTKEVAEKKMAAINEAYEVLSDPELRARFDRGDDPNSHEQQNPFQGSPFGSGGGGQPFMFRQGGQGQQFQFKFGSGGGFPFGG
ncbi:DnaJ domain-containing protein [Pleurostoma richardsiae]|uniref:Tetratricopeptide repeat and J domain-containing co-chaperone DNJ1 n=1 Tax=Pleurostoma richardsiae TaxID=41990 RepID=A0AA38VC36_9PEZI|nr:DnaJ domain-containing protein [Pleurostoma richardsiae]